MIRTVSTFFTFAKSKTFTIDNIFTKQALGQFTSHGDQELSKLFASRHEQRKIWKTYDAEEQKKIINNFIDKFREEENMQKCTRLLSGCTGKQIQECESQLNVALKIFKYQVDKTILKTNKFGQNGYKFEPFDFITSVFDHRHPLLSAFSYLGLTLTSNNILLYRPSLTVLPPVRLIQQFWEQCSEAKMVHCLVDSQNDPKNKDSCMLNVLNNTHGFMSFTGRLLDGLDFHYYISQSNQVFRENQFLLTSSDSAYVMKDLSEQQLKKSAKIIARACFSNCGHNFNSIKRVFVDREHSEKFEALLLEEAKNYSIHQSIKENMIESGYNEGKLAPYLKKEQFEQSIKRLSEIKEQEKEIKLLQGGQAQTIKTEKTQLNFITPAIFKILQDFPSYNYQNLQCMIPICFLSTVDSTSSCIQKINSSIFGSTATIFTSNPTAVLKISENIEVGTVNVNTWEVTDGIAYSGRKRSGKGFSMSPLSYNNVVRSKAVHFA